MYAFDLEYWNTLVQNVTEEDKPEPPKTRKKGGKKGRNHPAIYTKGNVQCPCMLLTEDDRLYCDDWEERSHYNGKDCLFYIEGGYCWKGYPRKSK